jgi:signal transduction histidine kinase
MRTEAELARAVHDPFEIFEVSPYPILICGADGQPLCMNQALAKLLEQTGVSSDKVQALLPGRYLAILSTVRKTGHSRELRKRFNRRILNLIFVPSAKNGAVYIFINDLTAQEETKTQLIQSEKMASLGFLVAGVAHEINTPMGAIHSNNDVLSRSVHKLRDLTAEPGSEAARVLDILEEICRNNSVASERIIHIIRSLKDFVRLDEAERKVANVHDGIESTLILARYQFKSRIQVVKEYGDIPDIECYPNELNQVFLNLLINAAQAITDHGTITIRTFVDGGYAKIAVSDTGVGIAAENLSRIFDPGFTTKNVAHGTGLGLSICYKIVQNHHGKIKVESVPGKGSTFTVALPLEHMKESHNDGE